jgi:hypothetical protein
MQRIFNWFLVSIVVCSLFFASCKDKDPGPGPLTYPPVTLYPVKESKTYIYEGEKIMDSMIFRLTFDIQDRLISQWSVKEDLILEFDYSQTGKVIVLQKKQSTNTLNYTMEYILNNFGAARVRNIFGSNGVLLQSNSYVYNSEGQKIKDYARTKTDSSLNYYSNWDGLNVKHYEYPANELIVDIAYTNIADNRNLGFFHFQKDRSYHLIQKEVVKTRGSVNSNEYSYQFDSKNRPILVITTQNGVKIFEKHYQYW